MSPNPNIFAFIFTLKISLENKKYFASVLSVEQNFYFLLHNDTCMEKLRTENIRLQVCLSEILTGTIKLVSSSQFDF